MPNWFKKYGFQRWAYFSMKMKILSIAVSSRSTKQHPGTKSQIHLQLLYFALLDWFFPTLLLNDTPHLWHWFYILAICVIFIEPIKFACSLKNWSSGGNRKFIITKKLTLWAVLNDAVISFINHTFKSKQKPDRENRGRLSTQSTLDGSIFFSDHFFYTSYALYVLAVWKKNRVPFLTEEFLRIS